MKDLFHEDSLFEYMTYNNLNKRCSKQQFLTGRELAETIIFDYYDKTNYEVDAIYSQNMYKNLHSMFTDQLVHDEADIIFPFCQSAMVGFLNDFPNINRYTFNYLTAEDINMVSMPLHYSSNNDICHSLLKQCEVFKKETLLTSITFSELEKKWNDTSGIEFAKLPCPDLWDVKNLSVKLTYK